ncbi:FAD:protein FMN transferase [Microbacterium sp. NPDC077663]|uniref:FAD:protein FMN transferase n=1 Tax=Microbacterium sp. NPDC077663 TaxID=3364189 RepID=UPI0037C5E814
MRAVAEWPLWSTDARLVVDHPDAHTSADVIERARRIVDDEFARIDEAVSRFRSDSELNQIAPRLPEGAEISPLLSTFVAAAIDAARHTDGLVDPTLGRELALVGYDRDIRLILDDDRPVKAVASDVPGWRRVRLEGRRLTVPGHRALDLGATAKALAADRAATLVAEQLGCGVLISLGGDIATAGPDPDGGWHVRVEDVPGEPASTVRLARGFGIATSSTLRRRWHRADETVHHILDPRTGRSADPVWRTVTVAAETCVLANTYSTAAVIHGESAPAWLAERAAARLVAADGRVHTVGGWPPEPTEGGSHG